MSIWMEHDETDWKDTCADLDVLGELETIYVDEIGAVDRVQHTNAITLKFSYPSVYTIDLFMTTSEFVNIMLRNLMKF